MESKNTCVEVFGKRLKELRKANGYTIEQFAEAVGISKSTVGYYENNNRMPDIEILSRIADVLNVSADYLIGKTNTTATVSVYQLTKSRRRLDKIRVGAYLAVMDSRACEKQTV